MFAIAMSPWDALVLYCQVVGAAIAALAAWVGIYRWVHAAAASQTEAETRLRRIAEDTARSLSAAVTEQTQKRRQAEAREAEAQRAAEAAQKDAALVKQQFTSGGKNLAEIDEFLREGKMLFSRTGHVVTARVFASPTGRAGIEWLVSHDQPLPPVVCLYRNGTLVAKEHAYRGMHIDQLKRGQEYSYRIEVYEGTRSGNTGHQIEHGFVITVRIPTPNEWKRTVSKLLAEPEGGDDRRQARRKKLETFLEDQLHRGQTIKELEGKIKGLGLDQEQEQTILAKVEAWMACEEERQEGEAKA